jgi:hypothetical protein
MIDNIYSYLEYDFTEIVETNAILKGSHDSRIETMLEILTNQILEKAERNLIEEEYLAGYIQNTNQNIRDWAERIDEEIKADRFEAIDRIAELISKETSNLLNAIQNGRI